MRRFHLTMRTEGITAFSNRYGVVVWTGENDTKTISVDANLFENGLVWTGPDSPVHTLSDSLRIFKYLDSLSNSLDACERKPYPGIEKSRIKKYPDKCGRGLTEQAKTKIFFVGRMESEGTVRFCRIILEKLRSVFRTYK